MSRVCLLGKNESSYMRSEMKTDCDLFPTAVLMCAETRGLDSSRNWNSQGIREFLDRLFTFRRLSGPAYPGANYRIRHWGRYVSRFGYVFAGVHPVAGSLICPFVKVYDSPDAMRYQRYVADALAGMAADIESCERVIAAFQYAEENKIDGHFYDGDEVQLHIYPHYVQVDIMPGGEWVGLPEGRIPVDHFRKALLAKLAFLKLPKTTDSTIELELP